MRPILLVLLMITALGQVLGKPAAAPESDSDSTSSPAELRSPQLLYMERLHGLLKNTKHISKGEKTKIGGKLLATSMEATEVMGPGNTKDGLDITSGNTYTMTFSIPNQDEVNAGVIQSAELWLFPRQLSQSQGNFVKMTFVVNGDHDHINQPRSEAISVNWNRATDCIVVDMTSLSKKVARSLEKKGIKQTNITVSVEIVSIISQNEIPTNSYFTDMCNTLAEKETKKPFLVVKHFVQDDSPAEGTHEKRSTAKEPPTGLAPDPQPSNCSVIPLIVDMTKLYGSFVLKPNFLDVKNCAGACNILHNPVSFNNHARMLDRFELLNEEKLERGVSCVPVSYQSADLLILNGHYLVIAEFPDMIVTDCACR